MNIQEMVADVANELPIIICILNNGYLGNVRQWQEMFFYKRYSITCMRYRKSYSATCNPPEQCCPEFIPDFIKLAESYSAKGIRVTESKDIENSLLTTKKNTKTPTVIDYNFFQLYLNILQNHNNSFEPQALPKRKRDIFLLMIKLSPCT